MCQDIWLYISQDYFKLRRKEGEIGSSTMPHKVNPIDFENAEGNLHLSNVLLQFFSNKLPISRLQRDLTDSTILRNLGVAFGYSIIAYSSILNGLSKLQVNKEKILDDLNANWAVVFEGIQTVMRREGIMNAYEITKDFITEHQNPTRNDIIDFINELELNENTKSELKKITPFNYYGKISL